VPGRPGRCCVDYTPRWAPRCVSPRNAVRWFTQKRPGYDVTPTAPAPLLTSKLGSVEAEEGCEWGVGRSALVAARFHLSLSHRGGWEFEATATGRRWNDEIEPETVTGHDRKRRRAAASGSKKERSWTVRGVHDEQDPSHRPSATPVGPPSHRSYRL
jgi:hypothetical protein